MDLQKLKEIINSDIPDKAKESFIIELLANDEKVIPTLMLILESERKTSKDLTMDMNLELSRAHIYIDSRPEIKSESKESFNKGFILDEIAKFYIKYKGIITHCFNRFKDVK